MHDSDDVDAILATEFSRRSFLQAAGLASFALATPTTLVRGLRPASTEAAGAIGTINVGYPETITRMDLAHLSTGSDEHAIGNVIEVLGNYDPYQHLVPMLAESIAQSDPRTYVYTIRPNVKFSDGTPLTMDDVLASCEDIWKGTGSIFQALFSNVKSMSITGARELTIKLKSPSATFRYLSIFLGVGKKSELLKWPKTIGTPGHIGKYTGPYAFADFVPGQSVTLIRNNYYYGPKPAAEKIVYKVFKDPTTMQLALQAGEIDVAFHVPVADIPTWQKLANANVLVGGPSDFVYMAMDNKQAPWSDVHIRRAIAHCMDKVGICKAVYNGAAQPARTYPFPAEWLALGVSQAQAAKLLQQVPEYTFDLGQAKAELAKSSQPNGFSDKIQVPSDYDPAVTLIAENLVQNLKQIGINLTIDSIPQAQLLAHWYNNKTNVGALIQTNGPTFLEASDYARIMLLKQNDVNGGYNDANYYNPQVEVLLKRAEESSNEAIRRSAILSALKIAAQDEPYIPIAWIGGAMAISKKYKFVGTFNGYTNTVEEWGKRIVKA